jgi:hypothetical protein
MNTNFAIVCYGMPSNDNRNKLPLVFVKDIYCILILSINGFVYNDDDDASEMYHWSSFFPFLFIFCGSIWTFFNSLLLFNNRSFYSKSFS